MSADLVWELTRKQNAFLRKGLNGTVFSTEKGNLLNKNTRKFSGLANYGKTLDITVEDGIVVLHRSNKKQGGKLVGTPIRKTNAVRVNRAAKAVARSVRPDLEDAAAIRASAVTKSLRSQASIAAKAANASA